MPSDERDKLDRILLSLASAESHEEQEEIGRSELASLIFHASPELLEKVMKTAKRDSRFRRCLAAARYYSGLSQDKCDRIDALLKAPFPAAGRPKR